MGDTVLPAAWLGYSAISDLSMSGGLAATAWGCLFPAPTFQVKQSFAPFDLVSSCVR